MGFKSIAQASLVAVALVGGATFFLLRGRGGQCDAFAKATEKVALDTAYASNQGGAAVVSSYPDRRAVLETMDVRDEQLQSYRRRYIALLEQHRDAAAALVEGREHYAQTRLTQLSESNTALVDEINHYCKS
ncbi:MAG: hypothetical protein ACRBN8_42065 [Nannocystales bacterium]